MLCLEELQLDHNSLTMLPFGLENLTNLTLLNISANPITVLPPEVRANACRQRHEVLVRPSVPWHCNYNVLDYVIVEMTNTVAGFKLD